MARRGAPCSSAALVSLIRCARNGRSPCQWTEASPAFNPSGSGRADGMIAERVQQG
jgi:hypothetical protein